MMVGKYYRTYNRNNVSASTMFDVVQVYLGTFPYRHICISVAICICNKMPHMLRIASLS